MHNVSLQKINIDVSESIKQLSKETQSSLYHIQHTKYLIYQQEFTNDRNNNGVPR